MNAKILKDVVTFLREHKRYQGKILDQKNWKRNYSDLLYERIYDENLQSDNELAVKLFGKRDHRYKDLKARFVNNLVTSVLIIEPHNQNIPHISKKYYALIREVATAKILMGKSLHKVAFFFAKRSYKKALEFGFYDIMYDSIIILKYYYGIVFQKEVEFQKCVDRLEEIKNILDLENKAYSYYTELMMINKKNRVDLDVCYQLASEYFNELSSHLSQIDNPKFQLATRLIRIIKYAYVSDFKKMLHSAEEDVQYFSIKNRGRSNELYIFSIHKTKACIRLGDYEKGLSTIKMTLSLIDEKNINWFPVKYNEFYIYMQSGRYQEARRIYLQTINHKRFKTLAPNMKEDWITGGAYLNYIIETGKLEPHSKFKFRLNKFLNEVPEYSKDRRVKNIPILIAQVIFMIYRKQTGKVIDRMDAIKQYCGRNLRYNEAVRSNSFIMALMEIPKQSFNRIAVERHITRFTKRLEEVPLHLSGKNFDLEIIPYERLLTYVLEDL